jgi:hypothetical protein
MWLHPAAKARHGMSEQLDPGHLERRAEIRSALLIDLSEVRRGRTAAPGEDPGSHAAADLIATGDGGPSRHAGILLRMSTYRRGAAGE